MRARSFSPVPMLLTLALAVQPAGCGGRNESMEASALRIGGELDFYNAWATRGDGSEEMAMIVKLPETPGPHPVFMYTVGTFGAANSVAALAFVEEMAARGFVAATVEYENNLEFGCGAPGLDDKAAALYGSDRDDSAAAILCARPEADCSLGIVVAGHSQGSFVALRAANFNPDVRAAWAMGTSDHREPWELTCLRDPAMDPASDRLLPSTALRVVTGESDVLFGPDDNNDGSHEESLRPALERIAGITCAGAMECLDAGGGGWVLVPNSVVEDGTAGHSYFTRNEEKPRPPREDEADPYGLLLDPAWMSDASQPWTLPAAADFLSAFVDWPEE